jgi:hypothetical protein
MIENGAPRFLAEMFADVYRGIAEAQYAEDTTNLRTLTGHPTTPLAAG